MADPHVEHPKSATHSNSLWWTRFKRLVRKLQSLASFSGRTTRCTGWAAQTMTMTGRTEWLVFIFEHAKSGFAPKSNLIERPNCIIPCG
jgi:hypothetical protein